MAPEPAAMRRRHDADERPVELELWADEPAEVSFGGGARLLEKRSVRVGGAVAVLMAVAVAVAATRSGGDAAGAPTTTGPPPTTVPVPPSGPPSSPGSPVPDEAVTGTVTGRGGYVPPPVFATDPGWDVYLTGGIGSLRSIDPTTGVRLRVNDRNTVTAVLPGPSGPLLLGSNFSEFSSPLPVGDGTAWALMAGVGGGSVVHLSLADAVVVEQIVPAAGTAPDSAGSLDLVGVGADGRPVLRLVDGLPYTLAVDGSLARFATAAVASTVERGQYAAHRCTADGRCVLGLHGSGGQAELEERGSLVATAFSPAGTHVAVFEYDARREVMSVRIVRFDVGEVYRDELTAFSYYGSRVPGWSPDGRYFVFAANSLLQVFDTTTAAVFVLADNLSLELQVAGVA